ncbi:MAG: hypothetical protein LLG02_03100 [Pelosinus sp.]|nr:hypothetical protein [Pelosinus sp.]
MPRKVRSDCTVGTFEKKNGLHPELSEIRMEEILEVTKKLEQYEKKMKKASEIKLSRAELGIRLESL